MRSFKLMAVAVLAAACVAPVTSAQAAEAAKAADGKLRILFTGDNGGEVSPCG